MHFTPENCEPAQTTLAVKRGSLAPVSFCSTFPYVHVYVCAGAVRLSSEPPTPEEIGSSSWLIVRSLFGWNGVRVESAKMNKANGDSNQAQFTVSERATKLNLVCTPSTRFGESFVYRCSLAIDGFELEMKFEIFACVIFFERLVNRPSYVRAIKWLTPFGDGKLGQFEDPLPEDELETTTRDPRSGGLTNWWADERAQTVAATLATHCFSYDNAAPRSFKHNIVFCNYATEPTPAGTRARRSATSDTGKESLPHDDSDSEPPESDQEQDSSDEVDTPCEDASSVEEFAASEDEDDDDDDPDNFRRPFTSTSVSSEDVSDGPSNRLRRLRRLNDSVTLAVPPGASHSPFLWNLISKGVENADSGRLAARLFNSFRHCRVCDAHQSVGDGLLLESFSMQDSFICKPCFDSSFSRFPFDEPPQTHLDLMSEFFSPVPLVESNLDTLYSFLSNHSNRRIRNLAGVLAK